jgi:transmembrane sensor
VTEIEKRLLRYVSGTASPEDAAEIRSWIDADPSHEARLEQVRDAWASIGEASIGRSDTAAKLQRAIDRVAGSEAAIPLHSKPPRRARGKTAPPRWHASPLLGVAAVLAVVIGGVVVMSTPGDRFFTPPMRSYATAAGERLALRLGDGSRIVLGPRSEVRLPVRFPRDARDLELEGTAYFEVAPDADRPFRVHAAGTVTRVLGTRFVVRAYVGDPAVEVAVAEGRVAVRADDDAEANAVHLTDGQVGRVDAGGAARLVAGASMDAVLGWTTGRLVFRDRPLHEIARELERWYDVDIHIPEPELARRALTLSFQDAPLDEVLGVIAVSLDAEYRTDGRSVTMRRSSEGM